MLNHLIFHFIFQNSILLRSKPTQPNIQTHPRKTLFCSSLNQYTVINIYILFRKCTKHVLETSSLLYMRKIYKINVKKHIYLYYLSSILFFLIRSRESVIKSDSDSDSRLLEKPRLPTPTSHPCIIQ